MGEFKVLKVSDLMEVLGCGKNIAYKLMQNAAFPSTKIGGTYIVTEDALGRWLKNNEGRNFII